jgi:hypothetical protein
MGTLLASQSLAAGATVTSAAFPFSVYDDITATVLNGGAAPIQPPQVILLLSPDNVNYTAVDRRTTGMQPSQAYYHLFPLQNYAGWTPGEGPWDFLMGGDNFTGTVSGLTAGAVNSIQSCKLQFVNSGATNAITVAANDGCTQNIAVVPLVGTTATTGGAVAAWQPPGGGRQIITRVVTDITTKSTGAANLSIGVAANATTSATTIQVAVAVGSAAQILDTLTGGASSALVAAQAIAAGSWVTATGSASTAGLVGNMYIYYNKP